MAADRANRARLLQSFWRDLTSACERVCGDGDLCLGDISYVLHEFALGLFALEMTKEQLMTHLATKMREIGMDELSVVNVGLGRANSKAWSDLQIFALRDAHPTLVAKHLANLGALARYSEVL